MKKLFAIFICLVLMSTITTKAEKPDTDEYVIMIGPPHAPKDQCEVVKTISKEDAFALRDVLSNEGTGLRNLKQKFNSLAKYDIFPENFIDKLITKYYGESYPLDGGIINGDPRLNLGLHIYLFCSFYSRNVFLNFPTQWISMHERVRLNDLIHLKEDWAEIMENVTILGYLTYIPSQVILGAPTTVYLSLGLLCMTPSTFGFTGPFIGFYFSKLTAGIYCYNAGNDSVPPPETPFFDIEFGISPLSAQMYLQGEEWVR